MQNDVLKNTIAPWQEKGRWYHGVYDVVTNSLISGKTDEFLLTNFIISNAGGSKILNVLNANTEDLKLQIIDCKYILRDMTNSYGTGDATHEGYYFVTNKRGVAIAPSGLTAGTSEFWVFIVKVN